MSDARLLSDEERAQKRALVTAVIWQGGLIVAALAFGGFITRLRPTMWPTLLGIAGALTGLLVSFVASSWLLARRNYVNVGTPGASSRRLRRANIGFTMLVVALAGLVYWHPLFKPHVASYSRQRYDQAMLELGQAHGDRSRYNALGDAAKTTVFFGSPDEARRLAVELLERAETSEGSNWNRGNAIHDGHAVLGLVALREGRLADAKAELLLAGGTPGSPQLDTFGPNMMLAKELLERHEDATVLAYFDLCGRFWTHFDDLARWSADVRAGRVPDFGANLIH